MADPYVAEIRLFPFNFAPVQWAMCNGQILAISQNTALFSLLGVNYGGNGQTNFALPNFQSRIPVHAGNGPGLAPRVVGETDGTEVESLTVNQIPQHTHRPSCNTADGDDYGPTNNVWAPDAGGSNQYASSADSTMNAGQLPPVGGNLPHGNLQPYLALNFCIALAGVFPPRS